MLLTAEEITSPETLVTALRTSRLEPKGTTIKIIPWEAIQTVLHVPSLAERLERKTYYKIVANEI